MRESHRAADGQIRLEDEPFDVGDAKLAAPRDPEGPPEETINCRCQMDLSPVSALEGAERRQAERRVALAQRRGRQPAGRFTPGEQAARAQWFNALRIIRNQNPNDPILSGISTRNFVPTAEQLREARETARTYQQMRLSRHAAQRRKERGVPLHSINEALRKGTARAGNRPQTVIIELPASRSSTGRGVSPVVNPGTGRIITVRDTGKK